MSRMSWNFVRFHPTDGNLIAQFWSEGFEPRDSDKSNYVWQNWHANTYFTIDSLAKCIPINGEVGHIHVWTCTYRGKGHKTQIKSPETKIGCI